MDDLGNHANTVADDELTLYLIIDEAHRGFNTKTTRDKATIVSRLVNGHAGYPPVPIVWGISATIERFKEAMQAADADRSLRALPPVTVEGFRVRSPASSRTPSSSRFRQRPATSTPLSARELLLVWGWPAGSSVAG